MNKHELAQAQAREVAAEIALEEDLPADATDVQIAEAMALYYFSKRWMARGNKIYLGILHDSKREGPCPITCDRQYKNVWSITTDQWPRARDWCVGALLKGYAVFYSLRARDCGFGKGTIADWRANEPRRARWRGRDRSILAVLEPEPEVTEEVKQSASRAIHGLRPKFY